jgi:hypothetical protein
MNDKPAVIYLRKAIFQYFPEVAFHWAAKFNVAHPNAPRQNENHPSHGVGGFVNRNTEHGNRSAHADGRAADIYVKIQNPLLKAIGDTLFARFISNAPALGVEEVIWNRQIWSKTVPRIHPYDGREKHEDHVHVAFTTASCQRQPVMLDAILKQARKDVDTQFGFTSAPLQLP